MTATCSFHPSRTAAPCEHFSIGDISLSLRSDCESLRSDFLALYGGFRRTQPTPGPAIRMEIEEHTSSRLLQTKRHYPSVATG